MRARNSLRVSQRHLVSAASGASAEVEDALLEAVEADSYWCLSKVRAALRWTRCGTGSLLSRGSQVPTQLSIYLPATWGIGNSCMEIKASLCRSCVAYVAH